MYVVTGCCSKWMRSRTSRGVPEWSVGKDLYVGSPVLVTGKVSGLSVTYRDHREGPGGPPSGATCPRRLCGPCVGGDQPLGGLVRPPQGAQGAGKSGRVQTLGQMGPKAHPRRASPLFPSGRHPDGIWGAAATLGEGTLEGAQPPPLPNPSPPPYVLGEALSEYCRINCTTPSCCRWSCLPQPLLPPCWIKTEEDVSRPVCVLNAEVLSVQH